MKKQAYKSSLTRKASKNTGSKMNYSKEFNFKQKLFAEVTAISIALETLLDARLTIGHKPNGIKNEGALTEYEFWNKNPIKKILSTTVSFADLQHQIGITVYDSFEKKPGAMFELEYDEDYKHASPSRTRKYIEEQTQNIREFLINAYSSKLDAASQNDDLLRKTFQELFPEPTPQQTQLEEMAFSLQVG